jgi:hypothetical protein
MENSYGSFALQQCFTCAFEWYTIERGTAESFGFRFFTTRLFIVQSTIVVDASRFSSFFQSQ